MEQELKAYALQIDALDYALKQVQAGYHQLMRQQADLCCSIEKVSRESGVTMPALQLQIQRPVLDDAVFFNNLLRLAGAPLSLRDLTAKVIARYPEYIPPQILDAKGFIHRKIQRVLASGHISYITDRSRSNGLYALTEWLDIEGDLISEKLLTA